jgi:MYXO-CTERM domain-containing protein
VIRAIRALPTHFAIVAAFAGTSLASTPEARAQGPGDAGRAGENLARPEELKTLEKNLADESAALSTSLTTSDCATACRALASIRRAAEKICALDPDERCDAARAKADDATRRVREACPECALAIAPMPKSPPHDRAAGKAGTKKGGEAHESVVVSGTDSPASPAPQSESRRGGCAGCATGGAPPFGDLSGGALAIGALALVLRRKRRGG